MLARNFTHEGIEYVVRRGVVGEDRPVIFVDALTPDGIFVTSGPISPEGGSGGKTEADEWASTQIATMPGEEALAAVSEALSAKAEAEEGEE